MEMDSLIEIIFGLIFIPLGIRRFFENISSPKFRSSVQFAS